MVETETPEAANEEAPKKRGPGRPPKVKAEAPAAVEPAEEAPPPGMCWVWVAMPDKVGKPGSENCEKASPGDRVLQPVTSAEILEERAIAYRDENAAKANYEIWARKKAKQLEEQILAEQKRQENRKRIKEAALAEAKANIEWRS